MAEGQDSPPSKDLFLRVLADIMRWTDEEASEQYRWLRLMATLKYDAYRDFQAGMRFIESLARWLQQFTPEERPTAYDFVRQRLVFVGLSETHHLVEQFYPAFAYPILVREIANRHGILPYQVLTSNVHVEELDHLRRRSLFLGLSDGARIDVLRHSNVGRLSNEQIVGSTQLDHDKWDDLHKELKEAEGEDAQFDMVFLIDDFTATGTSFLRLDKGKWKGKLVKFKNSIEKHKGTLFSEDWKIQVHHYIGSHAVRDKIRTAYDQATNEVFADATWSDVGFSFGLVFPESLPLSAEHGDDGFIQLAHKYYNSGIQTKHSEVGGAPRIDLGYGGCALPVVLEHNTPNNSVALLWAEHDQTTEPPMTPLFRRRQRHV